jgi:hypothetical protein
LPRLRIKTGQSSHQESLLGPPLDKKERRRCYSFDKGDDEILSVTSPTFPNQGIYGPPMSPAGEDVPTRAETNEFLAVMSGLGMVAPNGEGGVPAATPSSSLDSGSVRHSSSTNTVRWVGEDGGDGADVPGGSNTGYGRTEGGA